jgi:hypothetical protein
MTSALSVTLVSTIMLSAPTSRKALRRSWLTAEETAALICVVSAVSRDISSAEWVRS